MADGRVTIQVVDNARDSARNFDRLDNSLDDTASSGRRASTAMTGLRGALTAVAGVLIIRELAEFGQTLSRTAIQAQSINLALSAATRGFVELSEAQAFASRIAEQYGLDIVGVSSGFAQFSASALRANLSFETTTQIFEDVSTAVTSLGLDTERTNRIFLALSQIAGQGTVSMEELRQQLGDSLPGAVNIAAQSLGVTVSQLRRLVEQGKVLSEDFLPAFARQIRRELGGSAVEASQTARAAFTRLQNTIFELGDELGQELNPALQELSLRLREALTDPEVREGLREIVSGVGSLAIAAADAAGFISDIVGSVNEFVESASDFILPDQLAEAVNRARELQPVIQSVARQIESINSGEDTGNVFVNLAEDFARLNEEVGGNNAMASSINDTTAAATELEEELGAVREILNGLSTGFLSTGSTAVQTLEEIGATARDSLANDLATALTSPFQEGETAVQRFGQVALGIIAQVVQQIIASRIAQLIGGIGGAAAGAGASSGGGSVGPAFSGGAGAVGPAFADGGVFSGGVQKFAAGGSFSNGIVDQPTFFPMANGGTGLMGEAGAEAIMPLSRDGSGRLGIDASNASPSINIINQTDSQIETVSRPDNGVDVFIRRVSSVIGSERAQSAFATGLSRQNTNGVQAV